MQSVCILKRASKQSLVDFLSNVALSEAGHLCVPVVLTILHEVVSSYVPAENWQDAGESPAAVALGVVANIFQKVIEIMALRLKKDPEEGKQVRLVDTWK